MTGRPKGEEKVYLSLTLRKETAERLEKLMKDSRNPMPRVRFVETAISRLLDDVDQKGLGSIFG